MRKGKVVVKMIEEKIKRQVTFSKRRKSLLNKAHQLSVLCDVQIGLIIFSHSNKLSEFCSHKTSMKNLIMRYQMAKEGHPSHTTAHHSFHTDQDHGPNCEETKEAMMREIENLKLNLQLYQGHSLNLLTYEDLLSFEHQLESSLHNARARKAELMLQQQRIDQFKGKEKEIIMDEQNQYFYHPGQGSSWDQLMLQADKQMAMTCQREEDNDDIINRQVKKDFTFAGEEQQPTGVLHFLNILFPSSSQSGPPIPGPTSGPSLRSPPTN